MSARTWPKYRVNRWIDTSAEAMEKEQATIHYGIDIQTERGTSWRHCARGTEPILFDRASEASAYIDELRGAYLAQWLAKTKPRGAKP